MRHRTFTILSLVLLIAGSAAGCKKKTAETTPSAPAVEQTKPAPPPSEPPPKVVDTTEKFPTEPPVASENIDDLNRRGVLKTIYFDYDQSDLSPEALSTLRGNGDWMKSNSKYKVVVQGHCDERGTIEYNLALGERRARAVRDYLTSMGITASRMRIVTYGEEQPAMPGHDESAWSKNRRAQFLIEE